MLFFFLYFYFYLYYNVRLFFSWVSNYSLVVPASGTGFGMAYIQRDRYRKTAASMRRRLKEMGTKR